MIEILVCWLMAGILLVILSILMYYYNIFGQLGFSLFFLLGILIVITTTIQIILWQKKWKESGITDSGSFKNIFVLFIVISVIVSILGAVGYILGALGTYLFDFQMKNTLSTFLIVGVVSTIGVLLSWIYVVRNTLTMISSEIAGQLHRLKGIKGEYEEIRQHMKDKNKYITDLINSAMKTMERNKKELDR